MAQSGHWLLARFNLRMGVMSTNPTKTIDLVVRVLTILVGILALVSLVQRGLHAGLLEWQHQTIAAYRSFTDAILQLMVWVPALFSWHVSLPTWLGDYVAVHGLIVGAIFRSGDLKGMADFGDPILWRFFPDESFDLRRLRYAILLFLTLALPVVFVLYYLWFRVFVLKAFIDSSGYPLNDVEWSKEISRSLVSGFILVPVGTFLFFLFGALPNVLP